MTADASFSPVAATLSVEMSSNNDRVRPKMRVNHRPADGGIRVEIRSGRIVAKKAPRLDSVAREAWEGRDIMLWDLSKGM